MRVCTISNGNCFSELGLDSDSGTGYYGGSIAPIREVFDALNELGGTQLAITYGRRSRRGRKGDHILMEIPTVSGRGIGAALRRVFENTIPLIRALLSFRPGFVISIDGWTFRHLIPIAYCAASRAGLILVTTAEYPGMAARKRSRLFLARCLVRICSLGIIRLVGARSRAVSDQLRSAGVPPGKLRVLYPFFGARDSRIPHRSRTGEDGGAKTVIFIGRLVEEKQPLVFLEIAARLTAAGKNGSVRFEVVGDGPLRNRMEAGISSLGLSAAVSMLGFLPPDESFERLCESDVLAIPSLTESFGKVAVEGLIAGVPVVASSVGGVTDIIRHGENGFLCPPCDTGCFVERISELLSHDDLACRMRETALEDRKAWQERESGFRLLLEELDRGVGTQQIPQRGGS